MNKKNKYRLYIFDEPDLLVNYELLKRESQLVDNYTVIVLDTHSTAAFQPKIAYHCDNGAKCAVTDEYGGLVVRLGRVPISFFELKESLYKLGYRSYSDDIEWNTTKVEIMRKH